MQDKILIISERSVKDNSIIEENLDSKILRITIMEIQEFELKPLIGGKKYKEVLNEIKKCSEDSSYEIPDDIVDLINNIRPFLLYGTLTSIQTALTYKATNKGFTVKTDTSARTLSGGELADVKRYYRSKFDAYRIRLVEHLESCGLKGKDLTPYSVSWYLTNTPNYAQIYENKANKIR